MFLKPKLESLLDKMVRCKKTVIAEDTTVTVPITKRSERDFIKRFDDINIDWSTIEEQLEKWGQLFRAGQRRRVDFCFNYRESDQALMISAKKKRPYPSTTRQMLAEREALLDAEQVISGRNSIWREVYNLMRCSGPPCHLGPYCWRDPTGKKHYKLMSHHLKSLIKYVEQGSQLQSHEDVPTYIREQLYAEEQQRAKEQERLRYLARPDSAQTSTASLPISGTVEPASICSSAPSIPYLNIPGYPEDAVLQYTQWLQSKVRSEVRRTHPLTESV